MAIASTNCTGNTMASMIRVLVRADRKPGSLSMEWKVASPYWPLVLVNASSIPWTRGAETLANLADPAAQRVGLPACGVRGLQDALQRGGLGGQRGRDGGVAE